MDLKDEKEKLLLHHKLEKKRIWLNRTLAVVGFLVVGVLAFLISPKFASELKKSEMGHQMELELAKQRQAEYYQKRLEADQLISKLYLDLFWAYRRSIQTFTENGQTPEVQQQVRSTKDGAAMLIDSLYGYEVYLDTVYSRQVHAHANLYRIVSGLPVDDWNRYSNFLEWLWRDLITLLRFNYYSVLTDTLPQHTVPLFLLTRYEPPSSYEKQFKAYDNVYLQTNYDHWIKYLDSQRLQFSRDLKDE